MIKVVSQRMSPKVVVEQNTKEVLVNSNQNAIVARSDAGSKAIAQVEKLLRWAAEHDIHVVGKLTFPHASGTDNALERGLLALLGRPRVQGMETMILVTDLSRLSRRGAFSSTHLMSRMSAAGVRVVTPDLGRVDPGLRAEVLSSHTGHAAGSSTILPTHRKSLKESGWHEANIPDMARHRSGDDAV